MPAGPRPDPPDRSVKLTYVGIFGDTEWVNVMWLYLTGSGVITHGDLITLANACAAAYVSRFLGTLSTSVTLETVEVVLYSAGGDATSAIVNSGSSGSHVGNVLPANVALAISWKIPPSYRGGHPRTYLSGFTQDRLQTERLWLPSFLTPLVTNANNFHADLEAIPPIGAGISTVEHGVVSFVRDKAWRTPPVFYRISSGSIDGRVDSQRRRLGHGLP